MILGVTGGVGSGKSAVSEMICNRYGFTFISCDDVAKKMMVEDENLVQALKDAFGKDTYTRNGRICREKYAAMLYSSSENRKRSDEIVHPAVWKKISEMTQEKGKNFVIETALPDTRFRALCDRVFYVKVSPEVRIRRLMENRGYSREYACSIIRNQQPDSFYESFSDFIIDNSGSFSETEAILTSCKEFS